MRVSLLAAAVGVAAIATRAAPSAGALRARAPGGAKTVIVQMFQWNWDSIAAECTAFLGPAGYGYVQASPAQETIAGPEWWTDYQPVSYTLTGKRGNRAQYQNMIKTCNAAGVHIIADTVFNHMTGGPDNGTTGTGTAGTAYSQYAYTGTYNSTNFHYCGLEPDNNIVNYDNRLEVQTCQLDGLADLYTESEFVRARLAAYANDLISLGVSGLRLDAAKHIATTDITNITSRLTSPVYITQEVIWGKGEPITPAEYVQNGDVQEFRYTTALQTAFSAGGSLAALQTLPLAGWVPSGSANVFVANHDTERAGNSLNYSAPANEYTNALVLSLAHPYGTPSVLSSYAYSGYDDGAPHGGAGTCDGTSGAGGWLCQHRWPAVAGMTGFRNTVGGAPMTDWVSPAANQIAFGRGALGFAVINNADSAWTAAFATSLPAGAYCDVVAGAPSAGVCAGNKCTVSAAGTFNATLPARSALGLHVGATGAAPAAVAVTFSATVGTTFGQNVYVVGSITQLGEWTPASGIALSAASYPVWKGTVNIPPGTTFEYKYVKIQDDTIIWESDPDRTDTTPASGAQTLTDMWQG